MYTTYKNDFFHVKTENNKFLMAQEKNGRKNIGGKIHFPNFPFKSITPHFPFFNQSSHLLQSIKILVKPADKLVPPQSVSLFSELE